MNLKFYAGLKVTLEGHPSAHITTAFSDLVVNPETGSTQVSAEAYVTDVEYWDNADVTVLRVECRLAEKMFKRFQKQGFGWDFPDYKPHITVSKGDKRSQFQYLVGQYLPVVEEYRRIITQEN